MIHHYTPTEIAQIKKLTLPNVERRCGATETHTLLAGGNAKWYSLLVKKLGSFL